MGVSQCLCESGSQPPVVGGVKHQLDNDIAVGGGTISIPRGWFDGKGVGCSPVSISCPSGLRTEAYSIGL